jgi:hypothetical protein
MHTATTPHLHYPTFNILLCPHRVEQACSEIQPHTRLVADSQKKKHDKEEGEQEIPKNPQ